MVVGVGRPFGATYATATLVGLASFPCAVESTHLASNSAQSSHLLVLCGQNLRAGAPIVAPAAGETNYRTTSHLLLSLPF